MSKCLRRQDQLCHIPGSEKLLLTARVVQGETAHSERAGDWMVQVVLCHSHPGFYVSWPHLPLSSKCLGGTYFAAWPVSGIHGGPTCLHRLLSSSTGHKLRDRWAGFVRASQDDARQSRPEGGLDPALEVAVPPEQRPVNELANLRGAPLYSWVSIPGRALVLGTKRLVWASVQLQLQLLSKAVTYIVFSRAAELEQLTQPARDHHPVSQSLLS